MIFTHSSAFAETLSGTIRVFDKQGNPNEDASGVVVFLDEISGHKYKPSETLAIRQINKKFEPNILPVVIGTTVEFPNDDTIFHNVFSRSRSKPFDFRAISTRCQ
ncbi:MAG: hypothetical protein R3A13_07335 [Bdellovibrionota bacterium]